MHTARPCVSVAQVALGEAVSSSMSSYLQDQEAAGGVSCKVITGTGCDTTDAARSATAESDVAAVAAVSPAGTTLASLNR